MNRVALALLTLCAPLLACTEPSGTGGTVGAAPPVAIADQGVAPDPEQPSDAVLASGDPAAVEPGPEDRGEDPEAAADGQPEAAVAADEPEADEPIIPDEPYKVLMLGDSLAATGFGVLLEKRLDDHPHVVCYRKAKSASGLARPDFYDWFDEGRKQVEWRKPDLVIVVMGGNDGQDLTPRKSERRVHWKSEGWAEAYRARVDTFLAGVMEPVEDGREDGARVLWLGLPQMGMRSLEKKLVMIRGIQEESVAALGARGEYLDTTPFLVDDQGALLQLGVVKGKKRELRAEDGIHFTMSGSEYLADKVYPAVLETLHLEDMSDG